MPTARANVKTFQSISHLHYGDLHRQKKANNGQRHPQRRVQLVEKAKALRGFE